MLKLEVREIIPKPDHGPVRTVLIAEDAERGGRDLERASVFRRQVEPAGGEKAEEMPMSEQQRIAAERPEPRDDALGPGRDVGHRFAAGAPVAEQVPPWSLAPNLRRRPPLVLAIAPLDQIVIDCRDVHEPSQLASAPRTLQWADEHSREPAPAQPRPDGQRLALAALGERNVSAPGVLPGDGPRRLAMSNEPDLRKGFGHEAVLSAGGSQARVPDNDRKRRHIM